MVVIVFAVFLLLVPSVVGAQSFSEEYQKDGEKYEMEKNYVFAILSYFSALDFEESKVERARIMNRIAGVFWKMNDTYAAENFWVMAVSEYYKPEYQKKVVISKLENLRDDAEKNFLDFSVRHKEYVDSELIYFRAKYLLAKKRYNEVCPSTTGISLASPYYYKAKYLCGVALLGENNIRGASLLFGEATGIGSSDEDFLQLALLAAARAYHDIGDMQRAEYYYTQISPKSRYYYEVLYELCWVLYYLGKDMETKKCIANFSEVKKTYLSKRIKVLEGYLKIPESEFAAFERFSEMIDYYESYYDNAVELFEMPESFWKEKKYIDHLVSVEPDIEEWILNHNKVVKIEEFLKEIKKLENLLEGAYDDLSLLENSATIFAERVIRANMNSIWYIQERLQLLMILPVMDLLTPSERNIWEYLSTVRREIKYLDSESARISESSFMTARSVQPKVEESESAKKLYRALVEAGKSTNEEILRISSYKTESMRIAVEFVDIISEKYKEIMGPLVQRLKKMLSESEKTRGILEWLYHRINLIIYLKVEMEKKRIEETLAEIERVRRFFEMEKENKIVEVVKEDIPWEQEETASLAQLGFIEVSWRLKEKETKDLDKLWEERKKVIREVDQESKRLEDELKRVEMLSPMQKEMRSDVEANLFRVDSLLDTSENVLNSINSVKSRIEKMKWERRAE